jgi:hypothetical protein
LQDLLGDLEKKRQILDRCLILTPAIIHFCRRVLPKAVSEEYSNYLRSHPLPPPPPLREQIAASPISDASESESSGAKKSHKRKKEKKEKKDKKPKKEKKKSKKRRRSASPKKREDGEVTPDDESGEESGANDYGDDRWRGGPSDIDYGPPLHSKPVYEGRQVDQHRNQRHSAGMSSLRSTVNRL